MRKEPAHAAAPAAIERGRINTSVLANFVGNAWIGAISLLAVPLYIKFVGLEGYGVIGFYTSLQLLLFLLDFGLSATMSREMSRLSADPANQASLEGTARTLEVVYWGIAVVLALGVSALAPAIAEYWLKPEQLRRENLMAVLLLMAIALALRWPFALYAGGLMGLRRQVQQNIAAVITETLRVGGAIAILVATPTLFAFFVWQAIASLAGSVLIYRLFWRAACAGPRRGAFAWSHLKRVAAFTGGMSGISLMVTILVQADKAVLSKMLPLAEFGQYVAAWTLASGIYLVSKPIFSAYYPELSRLAALADAPRELAIFRHGYALMAATVVPLATVFICFSREVIELWTGNPAIAGNVHGVFAVLVLGTALNALMNMPYAIQLAHGWTSLALKANVVAVAVLVPLIVALTRAFGMIGAAYAWLLLHVGYALTIIPIMRRRRRLPGSPWDLYRDFFILPLVVSLAVVVAAKALLAYAGSHGPAVVIVGIAGALIASVGLTMAAVTETRPMLAHVFARATRAF